MRSTYTLPLLARQPDLDQFRGSTRQASSSTSQSTLSRQDAYSTPSNQGSHRGPSQGSYRGPSQGSYRGPSQGPLSSSQQHPAPFQIPTIRLVQATPSASGGNTSHISGETSFAGSVVSVPSPLAPRVVSGTDNSVGPTKRRLVPKRSKLGLLGGSKKEKDLSDVVRRVGAGKTKGGNGGGGGGKVGTSGRGGFEIWVDQDEDPEFGEIVFVKKKKSRAGLGGVFGVLGEVTNVGEGVKSGDDGEVVKDKGGKEGKGKDKKGENGKEGKEKEGKDKGMLRVKGEESKWWSIGRGRKDSKEKEGERSKTPDPEKLFNSSPIDSRARFNSLDSGILLATPTSANAPTYRERDLPPPPPTSVIFGPGLYGGSMPASEVDTPPSKKALPPVMSALPPRTVSLAREGQARAASLSIERALSPVEVEGRAASLSIERALSPLGGAPTSSLLSPTDGRATTADGRASPSLLAPPGASASGSIAVRAMKSMRSLAHIGSWAQLKGGEGSVGGSVRRKDESVKGKKDESVKGKKEKEKSEDGKGKKEKSEKKEKKKSKKGSSKEERDEERNATVRYSGSSFEAGALSGAGSPGKGVDVKELGRRKQSTLGLGWPSTMRLAMVRHPSGSGVHSSSNSNSTSSSSSSSSDLNQPNLNRLSAASSISLGAGLGLGLGRDRLPSTLSSGSSLRPASTSSERTGKSSSGSVVSVRWDEQGLESVKETIGVERRMKRAEEAEQAKVVGTRRGVSGESRKASEARRRKPVLDLFAQVEAEVEAEGMVVDDPQLPESPMEVVEEEEEKEEEAEAEVSEKETERPMLMLEEATEDGHAQLELNLSMGSVGTPVKPRRARPVSETLVGRTRPAGMYDEGDGFMSILDAATNDLASLIDRLDLEATPGGTPRGSPRKSRPSPLSAASQRSDLADGFLTKRRLEFESPVKKPTLRESAASINSLRPYAQSRGKAPTFTAPTAASRGLGLQIAPWPVSPAKPKAVSTAPAMSGTIRLVGGSPVFKPSHKRTMSPPMPLEDSMPVFRPLRPRLASPPHLGPALFAKEGSSATTTPVGHSDLAAPSSLTFGSRPSKIGLLAVEDNGAPSPTPVFRRATGEERKRSSLIGMKSHSSLRDSMPIPPEGKRVLGLAGTMGGSVGSTAPALNPDDPDSDIPDELQVILSGQSDNESCDDATSVGDYSPAPPPSPGLPPASPLPTPAPVLSLDFSMDVPVFQLNDEEGNHADIDECFVSSPSEDDTKKSFDFTGELMKLNESGGSERLSFIEQLENAFKTPAKLNLHAGFAEFLDVNGPLDIEVPPVPRLPQALQVDEAVRFSDLSFAVETTGDMKDISMAVPLSCHETSDPDISTPEEPSPRSLKHNSSMGSRPSDGQLNRSFRFGGLPSPARSVSLKENSPKPLTLPDIIPSPSHARSLSEASLCSIVEEDSSVLKSIFAQAAEIAPLQPRIRLDSDSSSKRRVRVRRVSHPAIAHSRNESGVSFAGLDSFDEIRRGFEFHPNRPAFYPPPGTSSARPSHGREASMFSIASVSSYGQVINPGCKDPFEYADSLPTRPSSDDMSTFSFSMSVDDTFSFMKNQLPRKRVESDASSFYFRAPPPRPSHVPRRGHYRDESSASMASIAPPVSLYNRSFGHRRNASSTSASSVAQSYAMFGANGGRAAWARHRTDPSVDSILSDMSAMRLGRPGLGDKMLESAAEYGMPLTAISASPDSATSHHLRHRASFDSILDDDHRSSIDCDRRSSMDDSLFEKTGHRTSMSSGSVFRYDSSDSGHGGLWPPAQFRPVSMLSTGSIHSPPQDDDTMFSMLGGGHVRRQSVGSIIAASPCVRMGKRKHTDVERLEALHQPFIREVEESPNKARLIERASMISTASHHFGDDRMQDAQIGLLHRQSLEESCLSASGEDDTTSSRIYPVFSRPGPASRSRSDTYASSGAETPPLSSDASSQSGDSQSSIDVSHLGSLLANVTYPVTNRVSSAARARARARGRGHRRRISQARASRSSVYETILEELQSNPPTPPRAVYVDQVAVADQAAEPVVIADNELEMMETMEWDNEQGITVLRKYYALKDEAQETVKESKRVWHDTSFSIFAIQSFQPPTRREGMQALLEHSQQNYGPLPHDLRPRRIRSRVNSRPSPYPRTRKISTSSIEEEPIPAVYLDSNRSPVSLRHAVLKQVSINPNISSPAPTLGQHKVASPFLVDLDRSAKFVHEDSASFSAAGAPPLPRQRVTSSARRSALGWAKRSNGRSQKENKENAGQGALMSPPKSLRIDRPRPRGRPTPARPHALRI
ncbi:hypothetical protein JAAARDRAFT_59878 [Jaapia argillacea MUCL 33604]|uniref:Uncharacterized protein n=1 Tax=Jaapia argillacea MUCL 33604 TaxID=933084 RepID=A0A067PNH5_9AGAM|nr:hypothetical protein JAAARDRAFT_59878 [Jaapia argillacea MUCL 33604]